MAGQTYSVSGKSAIVTGAGSGINLAFTSILLSHGCNVLLADLTLRPEAQRLVDSYSSPTSQPRAIFLPTNVISWPDLQRTFTVAFREFGSVDIVCPGAGVYEPHWSNFWLPPGSEASQDDVEGGRYAMLDICLTHPLRMTQLAISAFLYPPRDAKQQKAGVQNPKRIVHVASIAAQTLPLHAPLYNATKAGLVGFIRSLAGLEGRLGIRVNGVAPGVIKTPLWMEHPEKLKLVDEGLDEWATAEEVAEAMLRLCEEGEMVGGTILEVGRKQTRVVQRFGDMGPKGGGHTVGNIGEGEAEVFRWLGREGWGRVEKAKI
ncbi:MAG: hypothetical protein M1820_002487 [Bogoriella megaspora]|nr:MAG: hypothetical protein M1820_002487 [Bogoriella megaspora]